MSTNRRHRLKIPHGSVRALNGFLVPKNVLFRLHFSCQSNRLFCAVVLDRVVLQRFQQSQRLYQDSITSVADLLTLPSYYYKACRRAGSTISFSNNNSCGHFQHFPLQTTASMLLQGVLRSCSVFGFFIALAFVFVTFPATQAISTTAPIACARLTDGSRAWRSYCCVPSR